MSTTPRRSTAATYNPGFPPGPSETHHKAGLKNNDSTRAGRFPVSNTRSIHEVR